MAAVSGGIACMQTVGRAAIVPDLEARFARAALGPHARVDGIVVLGGGSTRMIEAVRLAALYPRARLLISGRGEQSWHAYALRAGIASERLLTETASRNTYENGVFSSRIAQPKRDERWLLVTSAAHMPRAMGVFRKAGFNVLAWPVTHAEPRAGSVRHEWLGLIAYRILGRTSALLPAPGEPNWP